MFEHKTSKRLNHAVPSVSITDLRIPPLKFLKVGYKYMYIIYTDYVSNQSTFDLCVYNILAWGTFMADLYNTNQL